MLLSVILSLHNDGKQTSYKIQCICMENYLVNDLVSERLPHYFPHTHNTTTKVYLWVIHRSELVENLLWNVKAWRCFHICLAWPCDEDS